MAGVNPSENSGDKQSATDARQQVQLIGLFIKP